MPHYFKAGKIPDKRHVQFRKEDGSLYSEELVSTEGFSSLYSLVYHHFPPTRVLNIDEPYNVEPKIAVANNMQHRGLEGFAIKSVDDYLKSRTPVLVNSDVHICLAAPSSSTEDYFFKNSSAHEMIFVHEGSGRVDTLYGSQEFSYGDYIHIPRGTIYKIHFDTPDNRLLIAESFSPIVPPKKYLNGNGQLLEHSPYCERDIREPVDLQTHDEEGDFLVLVKKDGMIFPYHYANHPFDAVGWDGFNYPWIFSIHNFEPITGRVHQPPPVHQTFEGRNFVVCSFCPRLFDYHPEAIPVPYNHSNVDSDEVLYYVDGNFMSRTHIKKGQITLHPIGIPHGPHPGAVENGIGAKSTDELAVMIDTFNPLMLTDDALKIEDKNYYKSWITSDEKIK